MAKKVVARSEESLRLKEEMDGRHGVFVGERPQDATWQDYTIALKHLAKLLKKDAEMRGLLRGLRLGFGREYQLLEPERMVVLPLYFNDEKLKRLLTSGSADESRDGH